MPRLLVALIVLLVGCQPSPAPPTPQPAAPPTPTAAAAPAAPKPSPPAAASPSPSPAAAASPSPSPKPTTPPSPVAGTAVPVTATRLELLNIANATFLAGEYTPAAQLYERVINTPPSADEQAAATAAINDLAHFRAIVAWLAAGQDEDAQNHLDALVSRDANAPLTRLAQQLWDQYSMTASVRAACAQLQQEAATQAGAILESLRSLGVSVDAATLCSVR